MISACQRAEQGQPVSVTVAKLIKTALPALTLNIPPSFDASPVGEPKWPRGEREMSPGLADEATARETAVHKTAVLRHEIEIERSGIVHEAAALRHEIEIERRRIVHQAAALRHETERLQMVRRWVWLAAVLVVAFLLSLLVMTFSTRRAAPPASSKVDLGKPLSRIEVEKELSEVKKSSAEANARIEALAKAQSGSCGS